MAALVARYVPITRWLRAYPREWLRPDLTAAITSWGVMVPVALAYAGLAGVPPELGLVTAFTALAAYAVFGTSRHLKVTVSSTMAIMSASVVAGLAGGDAATYVALTAALALIVGGILVAAGIARLGFISDFLTKSVVTGFIFGLAITIIVGQLPEDPGRPGSHRLAAGTGGAARRLPPGHQPVHAGGRPRRPRPDPRAASDLAEDPGAADRARPRDRGRHRPGIGGARGERRRRRGDRRAAPLDPVRAADVHPLPRPRGGRDRVPGGGRVGRRRPRLCRAPPRRDRRRPGAAGARRRQPRVRPVRRVHGGRKPVADGHRRSRPARSRSSRHWSRRVSSWRRRCSWRPCSRTCPTPSWVRS